MAERRPEKRRVDKRQIALLGLAGLGGVFAALNLDEVTPLIIVIAISTLFGAGLGYLVARRRRA